MHNLILNSEMKDISSARRSQRRRNKIPKRKNAQYSIPNPYRIESCHELLPHNLQKQLQKLDQISSKSLKTISYEKLCFDEDMGEVLDKMKVAVKKQQQQFINLIRSRRQGMERQILMEMNGENNKKQYIKEDNSMQDEDRQMLRHESVQSIFCDNYESDKLVFYSDHNMGNNCMKDDYENYLL